MGGHKLYIDCVGEGSPTVIMDAGLTSGGEVWSKVQPSVGEITRACSYDRAGVDRSEPGPRPGTSQQVVDELHSLLANAGIDGPYVLVGHSFGGLNMQLYNATFPEVVVGTVLVESLHGETWLRMQEVLGPGRWDAIEDQVNRNSEDVDLLRSTDQVRAAGTLGSTPLVVLSAGRRLPNPFSTDLMTSARLELSWRQLQKDLASRSTNGTQIIAQKSGHSVHRDQPDLVIEAITGLVESARK